jgi:formylglycine-generating enzyme required for sulfatase activity
MKKLIVGMILLSAVALGLYAFKTTRGPSETLACEDFSEHAQALHLGMVWVPAGSFAMGDSVYPEEKKSKVIHVKGFWMDQTEVTNAQFMAFVKATGYVTVAEREVDKVKHPHLPSDMYQAGALVFFQPKSQTVGNDPNQWWRYQPGANWLHPGGPGTSIKGREAFPVVGLTLEDAKAYALWKGNEIPTEAQWEWAARGAEQQLPQLHEQPKDANTWQGVFPVVNSRDDGFIGVAPVGCYAPNKLGLYDMIGNVWELTSDIFVQDRSAGLNSEPDQAPLKTTGSKATLRVIKGGSFLCSSDYCMRYRTGSRQPQEEDLGASHLGFRTVRGAPGPSLLP